MINPLHPILWVLRQNEKDMINLYNFLTPIVTLTTGSKMLNFGYWSHKTKNLIEAQQDLCGIVGSFADLKSAVDILDIGSGFCDPALQWKNTYRSLAITCVNINTQELYDASKVIIHESSEEVKPSSSMSGYYGSTVTLANSKNSRGHISLINATATTLPFKEHSMDRIIALESAQHFRPIVKFIRESSRILRNGGLLIIAIPVTRMVKTHTRTNTLSQIDCLIQSLLHFAKLGLLSLTWASEHYELDIIRSLLEENGFMIHDIEHIGSRVYEPLAEYYLKSRKLIRDSIMDKHRTSPIRNILYSSIENIVYKSALKMDDLSRKKIIDYVLIKAEK